jgi:protein gp37
MAKAAAWSDLRGVDRPEKPWLNGLPRLIFVSDMSDALSAAIDFEFLKREIIDVCESEKGQRHQWLWLTKRPSRMLDFHLWLAQIWPENLWVGTSITTQKSASRLNYLTDIPARIRFVSIEPQWEPIDLTDWMHKIHWGIGGGQSGAEAKPYNLNWARQLILQFASFDIPYFQKQLGAGPVNAFDVAIKLKDSHGGEWSEWPNDLKVRQFPNVAKMVETPRS